MRIISDLFAIVREYGLVGIWKYIIGELEVIHLEDLYEESDKSTDMGSKGNRNNYKGKLRPPQ